MTRVRARPIAFAVTAAAAAAVVTAGQPASVALVICSIVGVVAASIAGRWQS